MSQKVTAQQYTCDKCKQVICILRPGRWCPYCGWDYGKTWIESPISFVAEQHVVRLGALVSNLLGLEYLLRMLLLKNNPSSTIDLNKLTKGQSVDENEFSNYDSLAKLIRKYNRIAEPKTQLGETSLVVDLRDAIAHGRVFTSSPRKPLRLYKFGPVKHGRTTVTHVFTMNKTWFERATRTTTKAMNSVVRTINKLKIPDFRIERH